MRPIDSCSWLRRAYDLVAGDHFSTTRRDVIVDGVAPRSIVFGTEAFLHRLRVDLKARRFAPLPVRQRMIPKANGSLRSLGIPTARDRVVQASLKLVLEWVTRLGHDLQDADCPHEVRRLGRTLLRWRHQIAAWHQAQVSNGPTEAVNNLIKRIKRVAFGFTRFRNYRIRTLLYAGRPNWSLLATVTPR